MVFTIAVLVGSVRPGRQGIKVAQLVHNKLAARGHKVHLIDPAEYKGIQHFEERYRFLNNPNADLKKIHELLQESDGFIAVTPEYNYTFSPQTKIFLDTYFNEFKYKPLGMVSYSGGPFAGVRAIENLKATSVALGLTPVPTFAVLPTVQDQFDEKGELKNEYNQKAFESLYKEFEWYMAALANHRKADPSILPK